MLDRLTLHWHGRRHFLEMLLCGGCAAAGVHRFGTARGQERPALEKRPGAMPTLADC